MRNTLNALRCDVVMGAAVGDSWCRPPTHITTPPMRWCSGRAADWTASTSLEDPRLKGKHIGVVAGTPPATVLVQQGLMALAKPYPLTVDTRVDAPRRSMANDIAAGQIDAGVLWGPIAGYYAQRATPRLVVVPLLKEPERMDFRIAMGVRRTDQDWKRMLNRLIAEEPAGDRPYPATVRRAVAGRAGQADRRHERRRLSLDCRGHCDRAAGRRRRSNPPPEPSDYRMDDYRSPDAGDIARRRVLSTDEAHALIGRSTMRCSSTCCRSRRVRSGLPASTIWRPKPRDDIPGSIWLPDTGYGALAPVMERYFERGLQQATGGKRDRLIVFYCLANCWMSWNAAKRALAIGYTHVAWYPEGTDGWAAQGLPLESRHHCRARRPPSEAGH